MVSAVMDGFKARDVGLRAQKKIFGKMANKSVAKLFIDETSANILDNTYKLVKNYVSNRNNMNAVADLGEGKF